MLTKAEKLQNKIGKMVVCDYCHGKQVFSFNWRMTKGKLVICPFCQRTPKLAGELLISF